MLLNFLLESNEIVLFQQEVIELISNIKSSKMIMEDKKLLVYRLRDSLLKGYVDFVEDMEHNQLYPLIPILGINAENSTVHFQHIKDTPFSNVYLTYKIHSI